MLTPSHCQCCRGPHFKAPDHWNMHWHSKILRLASFSSSALGSQVLLLHIELCLLTLNEPWMVPYSSQTSTGPTQGETPAGIGGRSPDPHLGEEIFLQRVWELSLLSAVPGRKCCWLMLCIIFFSIRAIGSYSITNNRKVIKKTKDISILLKVTKPGLSTLFRTALSVIS